MPLLAVVAFQGNSLALALIMAANRQHQRIDDIVVGAEQAHFPSRDAVEQPPKGPFVAVAALPVNQPSGRAVVSLPDPDLVVPALQEVPHFIEFDVDWHPSLGYGRTTSTALIHLVNLL